jgi:hypothetical protein
MVRDAQKADSTFSSNLDGKSDQIQVGIAEAPKGWTGSESITAHSRNLLHLSCTKARRRETCSKNGLNLARPSSE